MNRKGCDYLNRIKELRKAKNLTITELSQSLKIPQSTLTNYENGKRSPRDQKSWKRIADFFGVSVGYVMGVSNLNRKDLPSDIYEELSLTTNYDHYYNRLENAFTIFSDMLISPLSSEDSKDSLTDSVEKTAINYDLLHSQYGPNHAKKLSDIISLVNEITVSYTHNKMVKPHKSNQDLEIEIAQKKEQIMTLLSELIESDKNFYTGDNLNSHKEFYSKTINLDD